MEVRRCMIDSVECCNSELKADRCRRLDVLVKRKGPLRHEHDIKTLVSISQGSEIEQRTAIGTQIPGMAEFGTPVFGPLGTERPCHRFAVAGIVDEEIGRASFRERVCQYV